MRTIREGADSGMGARSARRCRRRTAVATQGALLLAMMCRHAGMIDTPDETPVQ